MYACIPKIIIIRTRFISEIYIENLLRVKVEKLSILSIYGSFGIYL